MYNSTKIIKIYLLKNVPEVKKAIIILLKILLKALMFVLFLLFYYLFTCPIFIYLLFDEENISLIASFYNKTHTSNNEKYMLKENQYKELLLLAI